MDLWKSLCKVHKWRLFCWNLFLFIKKGVAVVQFELNCNKKGKNQEELTCWASLQLDWVIFVMICRIVIFLCLFQLRFAPLAGLAGVILRRIKRRDAPARRRLVRSRQADGVISEATRRHLPAPARYSWGKCDAISGIISQSKWLIDRRPRSSHTGCKLEKKKYKKTAPPPRRPSFYSNVSVRLRAGFALKLRLNYK